MTMEPTTLGSKAFPIAAVAVLAGNIACINSAGFYTNGAVATGLRARGYFLESKDNSAGAAGDEVAVVQTGYAREGGILLASLANTQADAVTQADVGKSCFIASATSVRRTDGSGTCSRAGRVWGFDYNDNVLVHFDGDDDATDLALLDVRVEDLETSVAAGMTASKKTVTVGHADLTAATNGTAQAINIGTALPANARIVGADMRGLTPFTGGGASAVTADIGTSGDVDAIVDGADLFAAAVDGGPSTMPAGIRPNKTFAAAGAQLIATFAPDGGHTLDDLTAGSVIIDILYIELA